MRELQVLYLRFYLALLARRCRGNEYKLSIICAMAMLDVKPQGWRNVYKYLPIISYIIKIARFIIIQIAYQQMDEDHEYAAEEEPDLLASITKLVDRYIIRGSHGAM